LKGGNNGNYRTEIEFSNLISVGKLGTWCVVLYGSIQVWYTQIQIQQTLISLSLSLLHFFKFNSVD